MSVSNLLVPNDFNLFCNSINTETIDINLPSNSILLTGPTGTNVVGLRLNNGELLIGSTNNQPVPSTLSSTSGTIVITNGTGTISLDVNPAGGDTFSKIYLTAPSNQINLVPNGTGTNIILNATNPTSTVTYTIPDAGMNSNFMLTNGNMTVNGSNTWNGTNTFSNNVLLTGLTGSAPLYIDNTKTIKSATLGNGQLLIGSSGSAPVVGNITGTIGQISVVNGTGTITLSTPQNISPTSSPTFASETLTNTTNQLTLGTTKTVTINSLAPSVSRIYTFQDAGSNSNIVLDHYTNTFFNVNNFNSQINCTVISNQGTSNLTIQSPSANTIINPGNYVILTTSTSIGTGLNPGYTLDVGGQINTSAGIYLPTSGGTPDNLNFCELYSSGAITGSNPGGQSMTFTVVRNGRLVCVSWTDYTFSLSASNISFINVLPVRFRPVARKTFSVFGRNNSQDQSILLIIDSSGNITYYTNTGGSFTAASGGFYGGSVCFIYNF